jgi:hypothetical protein
MKVYDASGEYVYNGVIGTQKGRIYQEGNRLGGFFVESNGFAAKTPQTHTRTVLGLVDEEKLFLMKLPIYSSALNIKLATVFWALTPKSNPELPEHLADDFEGYWAFTRVADEEELMRRSERGFDVDWFMNFPEDQFRELYFPNSKILEGIEECGRVNEQSGNLRLRLCDD